MCCDMHHAASPHSSTPNVSSVHHADSRGSLVSTDSGNSLLDKSSDKTNSLEKVDKDFRLKVCHYTLSVAAETEIHLKETVHPKSKTEKQQPENVYKRM